MTSVNPYKFILQVCLVLAAKGSPSQRRRGGGEVRIKKQRKRLHYRSKFRICIGNYYILQLFSLRE